MTKIEFIKLLDEQGVNYTQDGVGIEVDGSFDLYDTNITSLPDNLIVGG